MNLRRKLLITFGSLALLGLVIAGISVWITFRWEATNEQLQEHYTRSLQAEKIRAATFRAVKEVPDALAEDNDARQEFQEATATIDGDFETWRGLADNDNERQQVSQVRQAYDQVVQDAERFFALLEAGDRQQARELMENQLEESSFQSFEQATERAVDSDQERREAIRAQVENTRQTAQLVLIIAAFGTISLLLLLAAYLASDLFRPLREVRQALEDVRKGDLDQRLDEERSDEIGGVNRAFNQMAESISKREQLQGPAQMEEGAEDGDGTAWRNAPSRVTLHRLVSNLRSRVSQLNGEQEDNELVRELDQLSQAVARMTEFGFPLDLDLARADVRALLYEVALRFQDEFAQRAVSLELETSPDVGQVVLDRLKLREALSELVRNALAALPEDGGGRLGLRSRVSEGGTELVLEVADDGTGADQSIIDEAFDPDRSSAEGRPRTGLTLTNAIVEQHGGELNIDSDPGEGTYVQIRLPLYERG